MQSGPVTKQVHVWLDTWLAVHSTCTVDGNVQIDSDLDLLRLDMKLSCAAAKELARNCASRQRKHARIALQGFH